MKKIKNKIYVLFPFIFLKSRSNSSSMIEGINDNIQTKVLVNVGQNFKNYKIPKHLDGMGAMLSDDKTKLLIYCNHEKINASITRFELDLNTMEIIFAEKAYDKVILKKESLNIKLLNKFCSSSLYLKGQFGIKDNIYLTGEEIPYKGRAFLLETDKKILHEVASLGNHSFENIVFVDIGLTKYSCFLIGDDNHRHNLQPLILYIGKRNIQSNSILEQLGFGTEFKKYYLCKKDNKYYFSSDNTNVRLFNRPEDICTNPNQLNEAIFSATNEGVFIVKINSFKNNFKDFPSEIACKFEEINEAKNIIQYPDNVLWDNRNNIYVQEDNRKNSCIWKINKNKDSYELSKIIELNKKHISFNRISETTGLIDITQFIHQFKNYHNKEIDQNIQYFLTNVQASGNNGQMILITVKN